MKHREFIYVGEPVPELNGQEKRNLLTASQRERCLLELEKQYRSNQKKQRLA